MGRQRAKLSEETRKKISLAKVKHGAYCYQIRQRYSDRRTREGKQLAEVMQTLKNEYGPDLSPGQRIILDRIREKLIVLWQIGQFADKKIDLISPEGELLPCLGRNFLSYSEALRRDLQALEDMKKKGKSKGLDYSEYVKTIKSSKE